MQVNPNESLLQAPAAMPGRPPAAFARDSGPLALSRPSPTRRTVDPRFAILVLSFLLTAAARPGPPADRGVVTILEGSGRLLRGPTWHTLALGGRVQERDVLDLQGHGQVQIELPDGVLVNLAGPGTLYLASAPSRDGKPPGSADLFVAEGWIKAAAPKPAGVRLTTARGTIALTGAVVVLDAEAGADSVFVESGAVELLDSRRGSAPARSRTARSGDFWSMSAGKPFVPAPAPPSSFLERMPRQFIDPLPARAGASLASPVPLAIDREVLYEEARPWLSGPYRQAFLRSLRPRLSNAAFRAAVELDIRSYPEWDRVLHPEKYLPGTVSDRR